MTLSLKSNGIPSLILVDGSSYLYRAFHALPPLKNSQGEPTGAVYGVANMLKKLLSDYPSEYMAVVFDSKGKTFRDDLYPAYKANRKAMPEELYLQIQPLYALIETMGIHIVVIDGVEADDVIGTLARQAVQKNYQVIISTSDKDIAQLVNSRITLVNTMSNVALDEKGVLEKFGVMPEQMVAYLTLTGDTSDNIPGVPGVGPKTAARWLSRYKTLDNMIKHKQEITGKAGEAFQRCIDQFDLIQQLVTIKCDVDLDIDWDKFKKKSQDTEKLAQLLIKFEFKQWLAEISGQDVPKPTQKKVKKYHCVLETAALEELIDKLNHASLFSVDTETTSLHIIDARIVGISFGFDESEAYYIPLAHDYLGAPVQLNREETLLRLKPILENKELPKIGHHIKYDINVFKNHGINIQGMMFDTMLESYVLDSTATRHDMDSLALKYLGKKTIHFEDVAGKGAKQVSFNQVGIEEASEYAAEDADITYQLHQYLWPRLQKNQGILNTFQDIEMPLAFVLGQMERTGVLIDTNLLKQQSVKIAKRLLELENAAYKEAGHPFNLASPKQLQVILYEKSGLPILEKTPSGQPSTAENVLQELARDYSLPKIILEHRMLSKLKTTYTDKLPAEVNPKTGRVHTSYQQAVASTGRLSSSHPNLQNIPIKTEEGRLIRKAFIAPPGYKILSADYSQIELRLMAHISQDPALLKAFEEELDIHTATASEVFNVSLKQVTAEQRRFAKTINFGLIYGMSAFGLAKQLTIPRETAQTYIHTYFKRYPAVKNYMDNTIKFAHQNSYVTTLFGRQLYLPDINIRNSLRQKGAERAAINAPLQGTAADLIKLAMINIQAWLTAAEIPARMIMQVHDELVFEIEETKVEEISVHIKNMMENVITFSVPLIVSIGAGNNWDEAH
jgi:DNA polymerase-1